MGIRNVDVPDPAGLTVDQAAQLTALEYKRAEANAKLSAANTARAEAIAELAAIDDAKSLIR